MSSARMRGRPDLRETVARLAMGAGPLRIGPLVASLRVSQRLSSEEIAVLQAAYLDDVSRQDGSVGPRFGRTVSSSGTGGASRSARWSVEAMRWQDAVEERAREWAGVGGGRARVWVCCNPADRLRRIGTYVSNTRLLAAGDLARDEALVRAVADRLAERPPAVVQGVSNVLAELGRELERRGVALPSTVCISAGNHLTPWYRRGMEAAFARPVRERYAVSEVGLIAATCEKGTLHTNAEALLVEVLDAKGKPLPRGTVGELAVTMLHNRAGRGVRRLVGDVGRFTSSPCECGRGLPALELWGRATEQVRLPGGSIVPPRALFAALDDPAVRQAQFHHRPPTALEVLVRADRHAPAPDAGRLERSIASVVGDATDVVVRIVTRIEPRASGKLPIVVVSPPAGR